MSTYEPRRFRLLDLVISIGLLVLLAGLILPFFQVARTPARLAQCKNNLRQLGLALLNYHDAHQVFPPGITAGYVEGIGDCDYVAPTAGKQNANNASGLALILPFIEERAAYNAYNFSLGCAVAANSTAVSRVVRTYVCPANPRWSTPIPGGPNSYYAGDAAPTDYVFSLGGNALVTPLRPYGVITYQGPQYPAAMKPGVGPFNLNSLVRKRDIRDGISRTIFMGEGAGGPQLAAGKPGFPTSFADMTPASAIPGTFVDQAWSQGYISTTSGVGGYGSVFAATAYDAWYDSQLELARPDGSAAGFTPLKINMHYLRVTCYATPYQTPVLPGGKFIMPPGISVSPFRSYHDGGCYFLFGDGMVRYIPENIDAKVLVSLSSIAGKEVAEPPRD